MNTTRIHTMKLGLLTVALCGLSGLLEAGTLTWKINLAPAKCGAVHWQTTSPVASGVLSNSGSLTFDENSLVDLTFIPKAGYQLDRVDKDADKDIWLDAGNHCQFGPVSHKHTISAFFSLINPTGRFALAYPFRMATPIIDVTTNIALGSNSLDIAMDESGKITYSCDLNLPGTTFTPKGGGPIQGQMGAMKTVKNKPTLQLKTAVAGTVLAEDDGEITTNAVSASVGGTVQWNWQADGSASSTVTAALTAKAKVDRYAMNYKTNMTEQVSDEEVLTQRKPWGVVLTLSETNQAGKTVLMASAILTKPSGERTFFAERKVVYTAAGGLTLALGKGVMIDGEGAPMRDLKGKPKLDVKSTLNLLKLAFAGGPGHWQITGGTIKYGFLGQLGTGNAADFFEEGLE